jgi:hypothetical protein
MREEHNTTMSPITKRPLELGAEPSRSGLEWLHEHLMPQLIGGVADGT